MDENLRKIADAIGSPVRRVDIYICTAIIAAVIVFKKIDAPVRESIGSMEYSLRQLSRGR